MTSFPEDFVYDKSTGQYNKTKLEQFFMIFLNLNFSKHFFPFTNSNILPNQKLNNYAYRVGFFRPLMSIPYETLTSFTSVEL